MKKIFLYTFLIVIFTSCFNFTAFSSAYNEYIQFDNSYTYSYADEDKSQLSALLGVTEEYLENFYTENSCIVLGINKDNKNQVKLFSYSDEITKEISNLSSCSDKKIKSISKEILGFGDINTDIVDKNSIKYIKLTSSHNDSGGQYTNIQYITIVDGNLYNLTCQNTGTGPDSEFDKIFENLKIPVENRSDSSFSTVFIWIGVVFFAVLSVFLLISIVKIHKKPESE